MPLKSSKRAKTKSFKCGSIARIINDGGSAEKRRRLNVLFDEIVEEDRDKEVKLETSRPARFESTETEDKDEEMEEDEDGEDEDMELMVRKKRKAMKRDSQEKISRTVFIGNLPPTITARKLKQLFQNCGHIQSVRLRGAAPAKLNMPKKVAVIKKLFNQSKDSLHGYIVFKNKEDIQKALTRNSEEIDGHHIRVDIASNREHDNVHSVFVGNLTFTAKEEELRNFFEECGQINSVRIVRDNKTGVGKGFGFVTFASKDGVFMALEKDDEEFCGRKIRVREVEQEKQKRAKTTDNEEVKLKSKKHNEPDDYRGFVATKKKSLKNKKSKKLKKSSLMKKKKNKIAQILIH